jgi:large subunit ribosomal protein L1
MAEDEAKKTAAKVDAETPEIKEDVKSADEATRATSAPDDNAAVRDEPVAKAGKRSAKALAEAEEKAEKEERKATGDTTPASDEAKANADKKGPAPKTRTRLERRGKNYRKVAEQVEQGKAYGLDEATALAAKTNPVKFDATVEMHINLNVDPRQADQNIRATVSLPHGTGKTVRVAVFAPADKLDAAKKAGADVVGEEEFLQQLDKEQLDFDILIATPQMMPRLGKYARLLGPRGLMPNPKSGTVTTNIAKAVEEAKAGRVEYRVDKQGIVHQGVGKVSFGAAKLTENAKAFIASVSSVKPSSIKGPYIKAVTITTTMGPGIKVDISSL